MPKSCDRICYSEDCMNCIYLDPDIKRTVQDKIDNDLKEYVKKYNIKTSNWNFENL